MLITASQSVFILPILFNQQSKNQTPFIYSHKHKKGKKLIHFSYDWKID